MLEKIREKNSEIKSAWKLRLTGRNMNLKIEGKADRTNISTAQN